MRILLVDDSSFSRTTLKRYFADMENLEFAEASNGIEALELHRSFAPDIIFMDITMPQLDGLGTLKIISMVDDKVKIIMVSALGNQTYVAEECKKYGTFAVLAKPVSKEVAIQTLTDAQEQLTAGDHQ